MTVTDFILYFLCAIVVPFMVSWRVCPKVVKLAKQKNLTDCPGNRKLQKTPVPVVGGVCVFSAMIISLTLFYLLNLRMTFNLEISASCIVAFTMIFLIGFFDDMVDMSAYVKFVFQFLSVGLLYTSGYVIDSFNGLFGVYDLPNWMAIGISLIAGVGIMNAINMIDGVNGLSSSVGIFFGLTSAIILCLVGDYSNAAVAFVFVASLVPFFIANAFSLKYKMFIGDSGALLLGTLGYMMVCSLLHGVQDGVAGVHTYNHSVALVLAIFAMPVFDTLRVMTARMLKGKSPFSADKTHLHHILLELKVPHLAVTWTILFLSMGVFGVWLATNWLIESALVQFVVVTVAATLCSWGTYAYLARCRDKKDVKFQKMIYSLEGMSKRIRSFRRRVEALYDGRLDRNGYSVPEFDAANLNVSESLKKISSYNFRTMEGVNYHAIDQEKILKYISSFSEVEVEDLIANSGAEKLRVYPILFELEQAGIITVLKRASLGAPVVVTLKR